VDALEPAARRALSRGVLLVAVHLLVPETSARA
jgi:hypothetical protein